MVPKRSRPSGSSRLGSAARRRSRASRNVTPQQQQPSESARAAEAGVSSNAEATTAEDTELRPLSAPDVAVTIEGERVELLQVYAMLRCLYEVLLYADDDDSLMHADVANVCARLINESVCRLDALLMHGCEHNSGDQLRESAASSMRGSEE